MINTLTRQIQIILDTHHAFLKRELPRLSKALDAMGEKGRKVAEIFHALKDDLESHMMKEEHILFPTVMAFEAGQGGGMGLEGPIAQMMSEHRQAEAMFERLKDEKKALDGMEACVPADTWKGIQDLDMDLREHIRKEEEELFPAINRAMAGGAPSRI